MKVVDNFLDDEYMEEIESLIVKNSHFPWFYSPDITGLEDKKDNSFYFTHVVFDKGKSNSTSFDLMKPILDKIGVKELIRIKLNLYYPTEKIVEHKPHKDYEEKNQAFILSLNTCDGFTRVEKKKIKSIRNRALFFDGTVLHNSSSCTNTKGRFNININYDI